MSTVLLRGQLEAFYGEYAAALDELRYDDWLALFSDDSCHYKIQSRENFDRGLPLATLAFESKAMLKDRIYGVLNTLFHAPYYQRHCFGPIRIVQGNDQSLLCTVQLNYSVFRTKRAQPTEVFNVGRTIDQLQRGGDGQWRLVDKHIVFDSDLIANSMIHPL